MDGHDRLAQVGGRLQELTTVVQDLRRSTELPWMRTCPMCLTILYREDPAVPVRCRCGWEWT